MAPPVKAVIALAPFKLRVVFGDGEIRDVDMEPVLEGPAFRALRDPALFAEVTVDEFGETIVWPNGADVDPDVLYGSADPSVPPQPIISIVQRA